MTDVQRWDAGRYDQSFGFVSSMAGGVVELLDAQPGERILDLGCGTGTLGAAIAERGAEVLGVDSSAEMVERARAAYPDRQFEVVDACALPYDSAFDAVFSNAVLHWVLEPAKAVAGIAQALKPGGRLVCEFGGKRNLELIYGAMMAVRADMGNPLPRLPKYFPDIVAFGALVQANGLEVRSAWLIDRLTPLENGEAGMRDWMAMFGDRLLADLPLEQQRVVIERSEASLRADLYRDGQWFADYRRLRMVAVKTGG